MPCNSKTTQLELFPDPPCRPEAGIPPWQALPEEARRALTRLMARLMTEHAEETADREAARHEA